MQHTLSLFLSLSLSPSISLSLFISFISPSLFLTGEEGEIKRERKREREGEIKRERGREVKTER
jgi:hypothetical protein